MSNLPQNIIRLSEAGLIRISPPEPTPDAPHLLERLRPFLPDLDACFHIFTDEGAPPWDQPAIVELVKARAWRQFIILCDNTSSFIVTLAMMALEEGYDVFVVCHRIKGDDAFSVSRLEKSGATLMVFDRFLEECSYGAKPSDAGDPV